MQVLEDDLTPDLLNTWTGQQTNETPSSTSSTITTALQSSASAANSHTVIPDATPDRTRFRLRTKSILATGGKLQDPIKSLNDAVKLLEQLEETLSNVVAKTKESLAYMQGLSYDHGNIAS